VPSARRVVLVLESVGEDREELVAALATNHFDALLLMPGKREEFHSAIVDLLSDWGAAAGDADAAWVQIVAKAMNHLPPTSDTSWIARAFRTRCIRRTVSWDVPRSMIRTSQLPVVKCPRPEPSSRRHRRPTSQLRSTVDRPTRRTRSSTAIVEPARQV
jgi:hypothetical protein